MMAEPKGKRFVIVNQKGGTGKTTVSVNLSVGLAKRKFKILLIDLSAPGSTGAQNYKSMIAEVLKRART